MLTLISLVLASLPLHLAPAQMVNPMARDPTMEMITTLMLVTATAIQTVLILIKMATTTAMARLATTILMILTVLLKSTKVTVMIALTQRDITRTATVVLETLMTVM